MNKGDAAKALALQIQRDRKIAVSSATESYPKSSNSNSNASSSLNNVQLAAELEIEFLSYVNKTQTSKYLHARPPPTLTSSPSSSDSDSSVATSNHVTCVLNDGKRVFLRMRPPLSSSFLDNMSNADNGAGLKPSNLLSKSLTELAKEADAMQIHALAKKKQREESAAAAQTAAMLAGLEDRYQDFDDALMFGNSQTEENMSHDLLTKDSKDDSGLWVGKYAPRAFMDLLSPEKINRDVLRALKQWDAFVFKDGSAAASSSSSSGTNQSDDRGNNHHHNNSGTNSSSSSNKKEFGSAIKGSKSKTPSRSLAQSSNDGDRDNQDTIDAFDVGGG